ncbi:MAG: hypothetical protein RLZZ253_2724, partial [Verrucomicrobiota bacterium]
VLFGGGYADADVGRHFGVKIRHEERRGAVAWN